MIKGGLSPALTVLLQLKGLELSSSMPQAITFARTSDQPQHFLKCQQYEISKPGAGQVLIRMLVAPINPQDIMVLQGKYPVKPENHQHGEYIPGYDGVGEILECGEGVSRLQQGDWVIPKRHGLGTWRTHAVLEEASLTQVSSLADPKCCAILRMCVTPAYLLLEDMKELRPGDWIIQNAASGVVGQMVSQFARLKGLHTISIIRDRGNEESTNALKSRLQDLGADIVMTIGELSSSDTLSKNRRVVLALDSVFGPSATDLAIHLSPGALFVNYGSLGVYSRSETFGLTQEMLFWKQLTFRNFRLSACLESRSDEEITDMLAWFVQLFNMGTLKVPDMTVLDWGSVCAEAEVCSQLTQATARARSHEVGMAKKQLIIFQH